MSLDCIHFGSVIFVGKSVSLVFQTRQLFHGDLSFWVSTRLWGFDSDFSISLLFSLIAWSLIVKLLTLNLHYRTKLPYFKLRTLFSFVILTCTEFLSYSYSSKPFNSTYLPLISWNSQQSASYLFFFSKSSLKKVFDVFRKNYFVRTGIFSEAMKLGWMIYRG